MDDENFTSVLVESNDHLASSETNITTWNLASEWVGYIALCMFSLVLVIPTFGIVGLMVWEYFSDEAERKAERKKEIDLAMEQHFGGVKTKKRKSKKNNPSTNQNHRQDQASKSGEEMLDANGISFKEINDSGEPDLIGEGDRFDEEDDDFSEETDSSQSENLFDVDDVIKEADCLLQKKLRKRIISKLEDKNISENFAEILT
ncbi:hypothetical protein QR98_0075970 [Sarcoptes scabiei]|uniref:Uncharacterized protein n=1 Tax=Sarcoptes scabiei TaxID=52283 RepID=A0A132ADR5_SARSC|nr:hypothetical protein QR98_0075970 [Sarcoptes scabiei]